MKSGAYRRRGLALSGVRDFLLGLLLFWGIAIAVCSTHVPAHAFDLARLKGAASAGQADAGQPAPMRTQMRTYAAAAERPVQDLAQSTGPAFLMLGFVFALLTMLNLAFARHLRRAYGPAKIRGRRG
ncbi:MAG: hypothetical protein NW223_16040 [Hyphomicrobiaceae bacterium]|nr:hypothetical protein [Hyphomicrobiaceae bacterium]